MGKPTKSLGRAVGNSLGYTIRMMVGTKTDEKTKVTHQIHNGKFGIYAGKNKVEEVDSVPKAMERIGKIVSEKVASRKK